MEKLNALNEAAKTSKFQYATWRTDKPKVPGFSHELISSDSAKILD